MRTGPSHPAEVTVGGRHRLASGVLLLLSVGASLSAFQLIWHRDAVDEVPTQPGGWAGAILVVALSAGIHELLHVLGWKVAGRVPLKAISLTPTWAKLGFRARLGTAVPATAYRLGVALPAIALGFAPVAYSLWTGSGLLLLWGLFFLLECFADVTALLATARVRSDAHVLEQRTGWRVSPV